MQELVSQSIELPSGELRLLQPRESAELPDAGGVEWAPIAPYWSVLWRSGVALARERPAAVRAFVTSSGFLDIGTPADYLDTCLKIAEEDGGGRRRKRRPQLRPHGLCRSPYRLPRRHNPAFHRALAICPPEHPRIQNDSGLPQGPATGSVVG